ncbi:DUF4258 domain-containing protein [Tamlana crocina]|uniref:DUF4258 domain-containing protein n=1 Tax=Tamlana crocina TaxID=393006 RepID=A0ABX1DCT2_9FLAO|nr:DUF4258 domain-containing protein [Tamlana crocina]NJX15142.1 DUF4258 domain-containing protein [Tamlana crocina]
MKLIQRIGYYLGGFAIGLVLLAFFLSGKKTSCSYGPEARVLKNINTKKIIFSTEVLSGLSKHALDSTSIQTILKKGDINFSKSEPRKEPCAKYLIEGKLKNEQILLTVENCDSTATVTNLNIESGDY